MEHSSKQARWLWIYVRIFGIGWLLMTDLGGSRLEMQMK